MTNFSVERSRKLRKLIIISGATATGKTALSIELAKKFQGEIISADALQVYKYMDIGTAKPTKEELQDIPYHLIDILLPDEPFDLYQFVKRADKLIEEISNRGKIPIVTGGTCLYIRGLIWGIAEELSPPDYELRRELEAMEKEKGEGYLHKKLLEVDPETAGRLHPRDLVRIVRALEVYYKTGIPISEIQKRHGFSSKRYDYLWIVLDADRKFLKERIYQRTKKMIERGLIEEVRSLLEMGYSLKDKPMRSIGYRHVIDYLKGNYDTIEDLIEKITIDTYRFSNRQRRWLKKEKGELHWIYIDKDNYKEQIYSLIERFLEG